LILLQTSTLPSKNWQRKSVKVLLQLNHSTMRLLNFTLSRFPNQSTSQFMKNKLNNSKLNWREFNNKAVNTKVIFKKYSNILSIFRQICKTDQQLRLSQIWTSPLNNWQSKTMNFSFKFSHLTMKLLNCELSQFPSQSTLLRMRKKLGNSKQNWRDYNTKATNTKLISNKQNSILSIFNRSCKTDQQLKLLQTYTLLSMNWQQRSDKVLLQLSHSTMRLANFELSQFLHPSTLPRMRIKLDNSKLSWRECNTKAMSSEHTSKKQNSILSIFSQICKTDQQLRL
jgi:hypothetical protein